MQQASPLSREPEPDKSGRNNTGIIPFMPCCIQERNTENLIPSGFFQGLNLRRFCFFLITVQSGYTSPPADCDCHTWKRLLSRHAGTGLRLKAQVLRCLPCMWCRTYWIPHGLRTLALTPPTIACSRLSASLAQPGRCFDTAPFSAPSLQDIPMSWASSPSR